MFVELFTNTFILCSVHFLAETKIFQALLRKFLTIVLLNQTAAIS